jgi:hypothetical protein
MQGRGWRPRPKMNAVIRLVLLCAIQLYDANLQQATDSLMARRASAAVSGLRPHPGALSFESGGAAPRASSPRAVAGDSLTLFAAVET